MKKKRKKDMKYNGSEGLESDLTLLAPNLVTCRGTIINRELCLVLKLSSAYTGCHKRDKIGKGVSQVPGHLETPEDVHWTFPPEVQDC